MKSIIERDLGDTLQILLDEGIEGDDSLPEDDSPDPAVLCDFLRDRPGAIVGLEEVTLAELCEALGRFSREGTGIVKLLNFALDSVYPAELFAFLVELFGDKHKRHRLIDTLVAVPWDDDEHCDLDQEQFTKWFGSAADFQYLLENHHAYLFNPEIEPLPFDPTTYWIERVRWYIVRCDFRRAWDELKVAMRGFCFGGEERRTHSGKIDPACCRFAASKEVCEVLASELLNAMLETGEISPLKEGERVADKLKFHMLRERAARRRRKIMRRRAALPALCTQT